LEPPLPPAEAMRKFWHGTSTAYRECVKRDEGPCEPCKEAKRDLQRKRVERNARWLKVPGNFEKIIHGTGNAYTNYKCRCEPCKEHNTSMRRNWRIARDLTKKLGY
jgi:hypothetical protein